MVTEPDNSYDPRWHTALKHYEIAQQELKAQLATHEKNPSKLLTRHL